MQARQPVVGQSFKWILIAKMGFNQIVFDKYFSLNEEYPFFPKKKNPDIEKHWYILFNQLSRKGIQNKLVKLLLAQNAKCIESWGQTLA